jgi:chromosome segregation ATPase
LIPWTEKINQKQSDLDVAKMEHKLVDEKINHVQNEMEKSKGKISELSIAKKAKSNELKELEASLTQVKKD